MEKKDLRSWLVRTDARSEIYVPPELGFAVSSDDFEKVLREQIALNELPVTIQQCEVSWDGAASGIIRLVVRHRDGRYSPLQLIAGLERVGHFYYVEEKLVWETPVLPPRPAQVLAAEPTEWHWIIWIVIAYFTVGFGLLAIPWHKNKVRQAHQAWEDLKKQTETYNQALDGWLKRVIDIDSCARTDDELGRTFMAVRSTIRQSIQKLFIDRHAELREQKEREVSRQELEAELEKRKQQGFQA